MAFLAFGTADVLDRDAVLFTVLQILVEMLINAVKLIATRSCRIREVDLRSTVTVDTPAHAQGRKLMYLVHLLDRTMAGLTLHFTGCGVLGMAKEDVVGKVVNLYPFDRLGIFGMVGARLGIITDITVQFLDLSRSIHFTAILAIKLGAGGPIFIDGGVTVHTHIQWRHSRMPADQRVAVTIQTADLVDTRMHPV